MPSPSAPPRLFRAAAAVLLAVLATGCVQPLSVQNEFFSPLSGTADRIGSRTELTVSYQRTLQAAQRACSTPSSARVAPDAMTHRASGPSPGLVAAGRALADLCATPIRPPVAAHGATSSAYTRWVEDRVRELPEAAETAAGAAGGS